MTDRFSFGLFFFFGFGITNPMLAAVYDTGELEKGSVFPFPYATKKLSPTLPIYHP